jgi:hypothetical protein
MVVEVDQTLLLIDQVVEVVEQLDLEVLDLMFVLVKVEMVELELVMLLLEVVFIMQLVVVELVLVQTVQLVDLLQQRDQEETEQLIQVLPLEVLVMDLEVLEWWY